MPSGITDYRAPEGSQDDRVGSPRPAKRTRTKLPVHNSRDSAGLEFVNLSALNLELSPTEFTRIPPAFSRSTSSSISEEASLWDLQDESSSIYTELSSLQDDSVQPVHLDGEDRCSPYPTPSEFTVADVTDDSEPWSPDAVSPLTYFSEDCNLPHSDQLGTLPSLFNVTPMPREDFTLGTTLSPVHNSLFQTPFEEQHAKGGPDVCPSPFETPDPADTADIFATYADHSSFHGIWTEGSFATLPPLMDLVDPELLTDISPAGEMEGAVTEPLSRGQGGSSHGRPAQLAAIDEDEDIWEVEALLCKMEAREKSSLPCEVERLS